MTRSSGGIAPINANFSLKRANEFDGQEAGFLGQGLGAGPVAGFAGFFGLGEEATDFFLSDLVARRSGLCRWFAADFFARRSRLRQCCGAGWLDRLAKAAARFGAAECAPGCSAAVSEDASAGCRCGGGGALVCVGSTGSGAAAVAAGVGGGATASTGGRASVSGAMLVMGLESALDGAGAAVTGVAAFTVVRYTPPR